MGSVAVTSLQVTVPAMFEDRMDLVRLQKGFWNPQYRGEGPQYTWLGPKDVEDINYVSNMSKKNIYTKQSETSHLSSNDQSASTSIDCHLVQHYPTPFQPARFHHQKSDHSKMSPHFPSSPSSETFWKQFKRSSQHFRNFTKNQSENIFRRNLELELNGHYERMVEPVYSEVYNPHL